MTISISVILLFFSNGGGGKDQIHILREKKHFTKMLRDLEKFSTK